MDDSQILNLDLRSPLFYKKDPALEPFGSFTTADFTEGSEILACFDLEPSVALSIEPSPDNYLGRLRAIGKKAPEKTEGDLGMELPAGMYLFAQTREILDRKGFIDMAIEVQKEGLWRMQKPAGLVYLRYVYEDGAVRLQIFRPLCS